MAEMVTDAVQVDVGPALDARVAVEVFGACSHDFENDDEACLAEARAGFAEDFGGPPPDGWRPWEWSEDWRIRCTKCGKRWSPGSGCRRPSSGEGIRQWSTNIAETWRLVERMRALGFLLSLYQSEDGWGAMFAPDAKPDDGGWDGEGKTAPLAICRAALATLADTAIPTREASVSPPSPPHPVGEL